MRLCFGTFARELMKVLKDDSYIKNNEVLFVEYLLTKLLDDNEIVIFNNRNQEFNINHTNASRYLSCKQAININVVREYERNGIIVQFPKYFKENIFNQIDPSMLDELIDKILAIIKNDTEIPESKKIAFIDNAKKLSYFDRDGYSDYLAEVLLYSIAKNNRINDTTTGKKAKRITPKVDCLDDERKTETSETKIFNATESEISQQQSNSDTGLNLDRNSTIQHLISSLNDKVITESEKSMVNTIEKGASKINSEGKDQVVSVPSEISNSETKAGVYSSHKSSLSSSQIKAKLEAEGISYMQLGEKKLEDNDLVGALEAFSHAYECLKKVGYKKTDFNYQTVLSLKEKIDELNQKNAPVDEYDFYVILDEVMHEDD